MRVNIAPRLRILLLLFWFSCLVVITDMSLLPPSQAQVPLTVSDKILHIAAYAAAGFLTLLVGASGPEISGIHPAVASIGLCIILGAVIEILQPLTGRSMELLDVGADALGAVLGSAAAVLLIFLKTGRD
jgi:VanZ family protein